MLLRFFSLKIVNYCVIAYIWKIKVVLKINSQKLQKLIGVDMINKKGGCMIEKCVSLCMNVLLFQMLSNTFP